MKTITVNASKSYNVIIGEGILDDAGSAMQKVSGGQTAVIVTDSNVDPLYGNRLTGILEKSNYRVVRYVFAHGEASKNPKTFLSLIDFLADEQINRTDAVIALGGGVTGDIAGFAAACYKRGTGFIQIPTTLLAAVDSSIGGKTGVNLDAGKNLLGSFYQPDLVLCDVLLFSTLTEEVFRDGCAEVIKCGIIADRVLFESLKNPVRGQLENVITRCVEIKRDIVAEDEFENSTRKLLNFGHTIGHAIEKLSNYDIPHGHAVAAGMAAETRMAVYMGICDKSCLQDILDMLRRYDLPESFSFNADEIALVCMSDKKRDGKIITMALPAETGKCILKEIPVNELDNLIRSGLETSF